MLDDYTTISLRSPNKYASICKRRIHSYAESENWKDRKFLTVTWKNLRAPWQTKQKAGDKTLGKQHIEEPNKAKISS